MREYEHSQAIRVPKRPESVRDNAFIKEVRRRLIMAADFLQASA